MARRLARFFLFVLAGPQEPTGVALERRLAGPDGAQDSTAGARSSAQQVSSSSSGGPWTPFPDLEGLVDPLGKAGSIAVALFGVFHAGLACGGRRMRVLDA